MIPQKHPWRQLKLEFKDEININENNNINEPKIIRKKINNNCYSRPKNYPQPQNNDNEPISFGYYRFEEIENDKTCNCIIS